MSEAANERRRTSYRERNREKEIARVRAWQASPAGREYHAKHRKEYRARPTVRIKQLLHVARSRARKRGIEFDAALFDAITPSPPSACPCCGKDLDYSMGRGWKDRQHSPSLDRFDNALGYVVGNVNVICQRCNLIKGDATVAELESVLAYTRAEPSGSDGRSQAAA